MKNFKKGISLIAVIAFLITALVPVAGLAAGEAATFADVQLPATRTGVYQIVSSSTTNLADVGTDAGQAMYELQDSGTALAGVSATVTTQSGNKTLTFSIPTNILNVAAAEKTYDVVMTPYTGSGAGSSSNIGTVKITVASSKDVTVTITAPAAADGTLAVKNGDTNVATGSTVKAGTVLTIVPTAVEGKVVSGVTIDGSPIEAVDGAYTYMVPQPAGTSGTVTIAATFEATKDVTVTITAPAAADGTLAVKNGDTDVATGDTVKAGTVLTIVPTAAEGKVVSGVTIDGSPLEAVDGAYTYTVPQPAGASGTVTIAATFEATKDVTVTITAPAATDGTLAVKNGDTDVASGDTVKAGTVLTIVPTAAEGKLVSGVTIDGSPLAAVDGAYTYTVPQPAGASGTVTIAATFEAAKNVTVTITAPAAADGTLAVKNGDTDVTSGDTVPAGTVLTIVPTAAEGKLVSGVTIDGSPLAAVDGAYTYTVPQPAGASGTVTIAATFEATKNVTVTITAPAAADGTLAVKNGDADVASGDTVKAGTVLTIVPTAAEGKVVSGVTIDGSPLEAIDGAYTFTVPQPAGASGTVTIAATFEATKNVTVTITAPAAADGTLAVKNGDTDVATGDTVKAGTVLTIVPTAAEGKVVSGVTIDGSPLEAVDGAYAYTVPQPAGASGTVTIAAIFAEAKNVTVTITAPAASDGTLAVKNGDADVASGDTVPAGTVLTIVPTAAEGKVVSGVTIDGSPLAAVDGAYTYTVPQPAGASGTVTIAATFGDLGVTFRPATGSISMNAGGPGRNVWALIGDNIASGRWSVPQHMSYSLASLGITNDIASDNPVVVKPAAGLPAGTYSLVFTTVEGKTGTFTFAVAAPQTTFQITGQEVNEYGNGTAVGNTPTANEFVEGSYVTVLKGGSSSANPALRVTVEAPSAPNALFFWSSNDSQLTAAHMKAAYNQSPAKIDPNGINVCDAAATVTAGADPGTWDITYQLTQTDVTHIEAYTSGAIGRAGVLPYISFRALITPNTGNVADDIAAGLSSGEFRASFVNAPDLTLRTLYEQNLFAPGQSVNIEGLWAPQPPTGTPMDASPVLTLASSTVPAGSLITVGGTQVTLNGTYPQTLGNVAISGTGLANNPYALSLTNLPEGTYTFELSAKSTDGSTKTSFITIHVTDITVGTGEWALQKGEIGASGKLPEYSEKNQNLTGDVWNQTTTVNVATNSRFTIYVPVQDSLGNNLSSNPDVSMYWEYRTSASEGGANGISIPTGQGFYGVNNEQLRSGPVTAAMNGWQFRLVAVNTSDANSKATSPWYTINVTDAGSIAEIPEVIITTAPESVASIITATQTADVTFTATVQNSIAANNLSYRWQSRAAATASAPNPTWADIEGATEATMTVNNVQPSMQGMQYRCIVTNNAFSTGINGDSNVLTMNVNTQAGAIIISTPTAASLRNLYASRTASFAVTARTDNGDPVVYQWFVKGVPGPVVGGHITNPVEAAAYLANAPVTAIEGATSAEYTTPELEEGVYEYVCRVTNQNNSALTQNSTGFYLIVTEESRIPVVVPSVNAQTERVGTPAGKAVTFSATAYVASQEALTYQWQASQNGSTGWADLPNQKSANFTLPNPSGENSGWYYRCVVTNVAANQTSVSGSFQLTVWNTADVPVVGAINPQAWEGTLAQANEKGVSLTSNAAAPSGAALTAVWQFNNSGTWTTLSNQPQPTFNTNTRMWESVYALPAANNDQYTKAEAQALNGQYRCVWTNANAGINDGVSGTGLAPFTNSGACTVNILVAGAPRITAQPTDQTNAVGTTATFAVGALLNPDPTAAVQGRLVYVWQMSDDAGKTWKNVLSSDGTGQFTSTLNVPVTETMYDNETAENINRGLHNVYQYRVNVANRSTGLNVYSNAVKLTITPSSEVPPTPEEPTIAPGADSPIKIEGEGADKVAVGITGTKDGITASDYLDELGYTAPAGYKLIIVNAEGEAIEDDAIVCTGYKLELVKESDDTVVDSVTIIITGDVLGTGLINISQLVRMARDLNTVEPLTGIYLQAGDFNDNGSIDIADLVAEARIISETIDIM